MKVVLQRVLEASVTTGGEMVGKIDRGYLVLLGVQAGDTETTAEKMAEKIAKLRIFPDENGRTNLAADGVGGEILIVSQFTLCADCRKGNRPSFAAAGSPKQAEELYNCFVEICKGLFAKTAHGVFGADMRVALVNDGPFTLILDSAELGFS